MKKDKVVKKIYTTRDYSKFKLIEGNREPKHAEKMQKILTKDNRLIDHPILVTKDYKIIDGQGRFLAAMALGLTIYYFFCDEDHKSVDAEIESIQNMNSANTKWSIMDMVKSQVKRGRVNFERFLNVINRTKGSPSVILKVTKHANTPVRKLMMDPNFQWTDNDTHNFLMIHDLNTTIKKRFKECQVAWGIQRHMMRACARVFNFAGYNPRVKKSFIHSIEKALAKDICEFGSEKSAYDWLCDTINKGRGKRGYDFPRYKSRL